MTPHQAKLLALLRDRALAGDPTPSFDEMAAHLGCPSKSKIGEALDVLVRRGAITREHNRKRAITVVVVDDFARGYRAGVEAERARHTRVA